MHRICLGPPWAADHAEWQACERLARERSLNRVIEARNPNIRPTAKYLQGPLLRSSPVFGTLAEFLEYEATREMGKYDPQVKYR